MESANFFYVMEKKKSRHCPWKEVTRQPVLYGLHNPQDDGFLPKFFYAKNYDGLHNLQFFSRNAVALV